MGIMLVRISQILRGGCPPCRGACRAGQTPLDAGGSGVGLELVDAGDVGAGLLPGDDG
jgi:hypothetical protein